MGTLIQQLLAFPPHPSFNLPLTETEYDGKARSLVQTLRDTSNGKLTDAISGTDTILDVCLKPATTRNLMLIGMQIVNPTTHPLPYLFALVAHFEDKHGSIRIGSKLWQKMMDFVSRFDPIQVRYCGAEFRKLLEAIERCASQDVRYST